MKLRVLSSILQIPSSDWQPLAPRDFPFLSYHFLHALETTDCLGQRTGWKPAYLTLWQGEELVAALVSFVKNNSFGEYIFDFAWAEAFESMGKSYYPKLVSAIPFTPATGPKILLSPRLSAEEGTQAAQTLLRELRQLGAQLEVSSVHSLFIPEHQLHFYREAGFFIRHSYQYHWRNRGYQNFDDFLKDLRSKRRREVVHERAQAASQGLRIRQLSGDLIQSDYAEIFHQFYSNTVDKKGGHEYLTLDFFRQVFATMKDQLLFVLAEDPDGRPVAGALNYFGDQTLFGRHWGCVDEFRSLHFELCYYQGLDFAIEKKFQLFEAGAQGEHKFHRGFLPSLTYSAHQIHEPRLAEPIQNFVEREKLYLTRLFEDYAAHSPFSRGEGGDKKVPSP